MSLARIMDKIDQADWRPVRTPASQKVIVEYSRGLITREAAERDLLAAGWSADHTRRILASADRNLKLVRSA